MTKFITRLMAAVILATAAIPSADAQFFDTSRPTKLINIGVRAGFNSSNLTNNYTGVISGAKWRNQDWGNGYTFGAVMDLNIRGFFTVQPGIFIMSRRNDYNMLINNDDRLSALSGYCRGNYLQIPVLASFRFGVAELAQLQVDLGPYFAWGFGGRTRYTLLKPDPLNDYKVTQYKESSDYFGDGGMCERYDWGIKCGVGVLVFGHAYVGAHYSIGCRDVVKRVPLTTKNAKGHNEMWTFTLGYNF